VRGAKGGKKPKNDGKEVVRQYGPLEKPKPDPVKEQKERRYKAADDAARKRVDAFEKMPEGPEKQAKREQAQRELAKKRISQEKAQERSGQLKEHFDANVKTANETDTVLAFRNSNKLCLPHIQNGAAEPKPVEVKDKTGKEGAKFPDGTSAEGLVKDPVNGEPIKIKRNGQEKPICGDYDLHDMIRVDKKGENGKSIEGGSPEEDEMIKHLNRNMNNAAPDASKDMVQHGAWTEWDKAKHGDADMTSVPSTVIAPDGKCYQIRTPKDWSRLRMAFG
jgi:hypothetical protein